MKYIIIAIVMVANLVTLNAQEMPERREVRRGNNEYEKENYAEAIEHYNRAIELAPKSIEPIFNLSNALIESEQFEQGEQILQAIVADSLNSESLLAEAYYNLGNSQFHQEKYEEALESYKQSILRDPTDMEAKYNYAYTKAILDQNQDQQDQDQNQDQQDQDQNQDQQDQEQNQDQQDQEQNQDEQDQDQNQDQQDQDQNQDQQDQEQNQDQQDQDNRISEQEQNQMLDAIQAQEDKTQDKLKEEEAKGVMLRGMKNW